MTDYKMTDYISDYMDDYKEQYLPLTFFLSYMTFNILDKLLNFTSLHFKNQNNNNEIIFNPLQCSKTLLNYKNYETDSDDDESDDDSDDDESDDDESDDDSNDGDSNDINDSNKNEVINNTINEMLNLVFENTNNLSSSSIEMTSNNVYEYTTFIKSNYEDEIKKINNPFYTNLNLTFEVIFEKKIDFEDIKENNEVDEVDEVGEVDEIDEVEIIKNEFDNEFTNIINELDNWELEYNEDYYKIKISTNDIEYVFNNLFNILNKYYLESPYPNNNISNLPNINMIFNKNELIYFKQHIRDIPNNIHAHEKPLFKINNFNLLNISDLYSYLNREVDILDYKKINFKNIEELRNYYNKEKNNFEDYDINSKQLFNNYNKYKMFENYISN